MTTRSSGFSDRALHLLIEEIDCACLIIEECSSRNGDTVCRSMSDDSGVASTSSTCCVRWRANNMQKAEDLSRTIAAVVVDENPLLDDVEERFERIVPAVKDFLPNGRKFV